MSFANITPAAGKVPIADGTGKIGDGWLSSNVPLKNAANVFSAAQKIDTGSGTAPSDSLTAVSNLRLQGADGSAVYALIETWASGPGPAGYIAYKGRAAGGTRASPAATPNAIRMNSLGAYGHNGTDYGVNANAAVALYADGTWSGANQGAYIGFEGTPNGQTSRIQWGAWRNGIFSIGTFSPQIGQGALQVLGAQLIDLGSGSLSAYSIAGQSLRLTAADGQVGGRIQALGFGASAFSFTGVAIGGTRAAPAYSQAGYIMCRFNGSGWDEVGAAIAVSGTFSCDIPSTWTATSRPCTWTLSGVSAGSTVQETWALWVDRAMVTYGGRVIKTRVIVSSAGTTALDGTDHFVCVTGSTTHTLTLPTAATGRVLFIKNRSSGAITVNRAGSDTIDGGTTLALSLNQSATLISSGTDWTII